MSTLRAAILAVPSLLAGCMTATSHDPDYVARFITAERAGLPFAPVTDDKPATTLPQAYRLQSLYVRQRIRAGDRVKGYKGGLMSPASLRSRNVTEPLVGTLFASGRADQGAIISLCGYRKASFELKLGHLIGDGRVLPVIDLPDIAYRDPDHYGAVDMVAANVSAARYVRGTARPPDSLPLDAIGVTLHRDGRRIASGSTGESLGGQRESVRTVVALARKAGRKPLPGDLIVTGKIGDRGWLLPGRYIADYGPFGNVTFQVVACPR